MIAADWHNTPHELAETNWLRQTVVLTADAEGTCRNGERVIDYVVAPQGLHSEVSIARDPEADWQPHDGLEIHTKKSNAYSEATPYTRGNHSRYDSRYISAICQSKSRMRSTQARSQH